MDKELEAEIRAIVRDEMARARRSGRTVLADDEKEKAARSGLYEVFTPAAEKTTTKDLRR